MQSTTEREPPKPPSSSRSLTQSVALIRPFISFRAIAGLSVTSIGFGLAEALVLVLVARIAFALSKGQDTLTGEAFGLQLSISTSGALWIAAALVAARAVLQVLTGWQWSHIVSSTLARVRKRMARAYIHTSWEVQAQDPPGRLQELLTSFVVISGSVVDAIAKLVAEQG